MMIGKRGISAIVATVLTILITVAAITIMWVAVLPMITEGFAFEELSGRVSVVTAGGYTVYDASQDIMIVQVKRNVDDGVMNRIKILFSIGGNTVSSNVVAPGSGQTKTYTFDFSGYGEPESISVAPIFVSGSGSEKEGRVQSKVDVPKNKIAEEVVNSVEFKARTYNLEEDYFSDFSDLPVDGLVSWWRFNDASDSVGENHGDNNGVTFVDGVGVFEGDIAQDYIEVEYDDSLDIGVRDFTISFWIKVDPTGGKKTILSTKTSVWNGPGYKFIFAADQNQIEIIGSGSAVAIGTKSGLNSGWHHIVNVRMGSIATIYADGEDITTSPFTIGQGGSGNNFTIGHDYGASYFNGLLDNVMVYDRVLSEEEITAIYENQKKD